MAVYDLFSKRQKRLRGEVPDVYVYDVIPPSLRVQIVYILNDAIGSDRTRLGIVSKMYQSLYNLLCREYGVFELKGQHPKANSEGAIKTFFLATDEVDKAIDIIDLTFKHINAQRDYFNYYSDQTTATISPPDAIEELNSRFKEHGVGYQFEGNEIIRVDSTYVHAEIVKPTLALLSNGKFIGPNEEYLKAHEHYRHGRNKECLTECLKAFESTMKTICTEKGWPYDADRDTSSKLIQICLDRGLIPSYTQSQFTSLRSLLESGIPTIRNRTSGHGQGPEPREVDDDLTRYGLGLTGANIILLVERSGIT